MTMPGYAIHVDSKFVIDCYKEYNFFECLMSYTNSPVNCVNARINTPATSNCILFYDKLMAC